MMRAIVLVLDHLSAKYLGPYGNTWVPTPGFNQLATHALLAETMIASSNHLDELYTSYLLGQHPLFPLREPQALLNSLVEKGGTSTLISSSMDVMSLPVCAQFNQHLHIPLEVCSEPAESIESTAMAGFVGEVLHWLDSTQPPNREDLLWIHSSSLENIWDAPVALREIFRGSEDPEASTITAPPHVHQDTPLDPDALLQISYPYAAQICVIDTCLAALWNWLAATPADDPTLLLVTAARALPLGIHGDVGYENAPLYTDQIHVPLFASILGGQKNQPAMSRVQKILQSESIYHTLMQWFDLESNTQTDLPAAQHSLLPWIRCLDETDTTPNTTLDSQWAVSKNSQCPETAIYTPAWFAKMVDNRVTELFVKPDDRWDINEIAPLREDVQAAIEEFMAAGNTSANHQKLPEILWNQLIR